MGRFVTPTRGAQNSDGPDERRTPRSPILPRSPVSSHYTSENSPSELAAEPSTRAPSLAQTASCTGFVAPCTEKERLLTTVMNLDPELYKNAPAKAADVTGMLLSLSKKERAMCLFNAEYLRRKVESARSILDALAEEEEPNQTSRREMPNLSVNTPTTSQPQNRISRPGVRSRNTPQTPELSYTGGSATTSPAYPQAPAGSNPVLTLVTLAKLPAVEIVRLASGPQSTGLLLPRADPDVVKRTDEFVNGLVDKTADVQKRLLGEKLFKVIKRFGVKNAPKITVTLLDNEDLRSLAHLMSSYPSVLKEKVLQHTAVAKTTT